MKIKHLILVFLVGSVMQLHGQDFHNSFFQFAPQIISPTMTGAFYGNIRANVIGRDQGRAAAGPGNEWQDLSLAVDGNIDFGLKPEDWISAGLTFSRSASPGAGDFRRQFSGLSVAYHLAFGKKADKVFTVGFKYGTYSTGFRNVNPDAYLDPSTLESGTISRDLSLFLDNNFAQADAAEKTVGDYALGFMLDAPLGKTADIRIGISSDHILQPRFDTQSDTIGGGPATVINEDLQRRINGFVFIYTDINDRLTFNPNLLIQRKGVSTNVVVQALFSYLYSKEKEISLVAGIGARLVDDLDLPIYLALDMKDLRVGISYDTNVSGLRPSSNTFGALELGITKIFNWNKKATVKPVFICPRL